MQREQNLVSKDFIETEYLKGVYERALFYLDSGQSVHFSGPSGVGKTSLALLVARRRRRPYSVIYGSNDFSVADLIGGNYGYRRKKIIDNFIHNVYTMEEDFQLRWLDRQLTKACREGQTLIYDEFSRTPPTVNNIFLSILEEGVLFLPSYDSDNQYVKVHPEFRLVLTSNPTEYAGVHKTQVALEDRIVTIELSQMDRDTEVAITIANSGLRGDIAGKVVDLVREYRSGAFSSNCSVRTCIKLAKVLAAKKEVLYCDRLRKCVFVVVFQAEDGIRDADVKKLLHQVEYLVNIYFNDTEPVNEG
ncbi:MAG TPA: gas vesicle protein GvpN [Bacillota bacterium]|nr:gas vesicle protein GvpN [Bacillota bacterium]